MEALGKGSIAWWIRLVLDVTWFILLVVFVLITLGTFFAMVAPEKSDMEIDMRVRFVHDPDTIAISAPEIGVDHAELTKARGQLKFDNPGGFYGLMLTGYTWLNILMLLVVLGQIRKIFHSLAKHDPFEVTNARRLRIIGFALIIWQFLGALMGFAFTSQLERVIVTEGLTLRPDWGGEFIGILFGLMILVIAEVFRIGAEMKEEQDLTV